MKAAIHERIGLRPSGAPPESPMDSARMPPLQIALADLIAALDWAGHTGSDRMAFVCRETGRIVRTSDRDFDDAGASLGDDAPVVGRDQVVVEIGLRATGAEASRLEVLLELGHRVPTLTKRSEVMDAVVATGIQSPTTV